MLYDNVMNISVLISKRMDNNGNEREEEIDGFYSTECNEI